MKPKIALFYHLNLNHYSLTPELKQEYIDRGIILLADSIRVPVNISISAQDLETIYKKNQQAYDALLDNPNIRFHISTYSHFLPSDFPDDLGMQLKLGVDTLYNLIPKNKIIRTVFFAEFDIPKTIKGLNIVSKYMHILLVNYTLIDHSKLKSCPGLFEVKLNKDNSMKLICIHKDTQYRYVYHKYLREMASDDEVLNAILFNRNRNNDNRTPVICHVDFEAPIINIVESFVDNIYRKYPPRYDLFRKLHKSFYLSGLDFVYLDPIHYQQNQNINRITSFQDLSLEVSRNSYYYHLVRILNANREMLITKNPKAYMQAINSDNFVVKQKDIKLKGLYHGISGLIHIRKSGNRDIIMDTILNKLGITT